MATIRNNNPQESKVSHLEESMNRELGALLPKVEALLSERNDAEGSAASSSTPQPTTADLRTSLLELAERGDGEILLRMLADERVDVRNNPPRTGSGDTALHVAASGGHLKAVIALLGAGAHVDVLGDRLRTPLHCAAAHGHLAVTQRLLDAGAKIDNMDKDGATALVLASGEGYKEIVSSLLAGGANVELKNRDGAAALELAAGKGYTEVVCSLLEKGAAINENIVSMIISQGNKNVVELCLHNGMSVDACDSNGESLLVLASRGKQWDIVDLLLEKGASPTKCKEVQECGLVFASQDGQADAVRHLLRRGAASNTEQVKWALEEAASSTVVWAFVDLLPDQLWEEVGRWGLVSAGWNGRLEPLVALLEASVDVDSKDNDNRTALLLASSKGHVECVRELLGRDADVNAKNVDGYIPLYSASLFGHVECVRELLGRGADANAKKNDGRTPLHGASAFGRLECVRALLAAGASASERDDEGKTPLDEADMEEVRRAFNVQ